MLDPLETGALWVTEERTTQNRLVNASIKALIEMSWEHFSFKIYFLIGRKGFTLLYCFLLYYSVNQS